MKKAYINLSLILIFFSVAAFAQEQGRFMIDPDIHGDKIVFTYEGDLWLVSSSGGIATRLTTFPGIEYRAGFSPDGKWIAFTASYDGAQSIYVMPSVGGVPTRITYNPGGAETVTWTPDSKRVVFRSYWENFIMRDPNLYFTDKDGSALERFPLDRGVDCSFSPDGSKILYVRKDLKLITGSDTRGDFIRISGCMTSLPISSLPSPVMSE